MKHNKYNDYREYMSCVTSDSIHKCLLEIISSNENFISISNLCKKLKYKQNIAHEFPSQVMLKILKKTPKVYIINYKLWSKKFTYTQKSMCRKCKTVQSCIVKIVKNKPGIKINEIFEIIKKNCIERNCIGKVNLDVLEFYIQASRDISLVEDKLEIADYAMQIANMNKVHKKKNQISNKYDKIVNCPNCSKRIKVKIINSNQYHISCPKCHYYDTIEIEKKRNIKQDISEYKIYMKKCKNYNFCGYYINDSRIEALPKTKICIHCANKYDGNIELKYP